MDWGLINQVVPRKELDVAVKEMCKKLLRKLPECTRYTKQQINFWRDLSWAMTIGHARDWLTVHTAAPEIRMSIEAFMKKRPVDYAAIRNLSTSATSSKRPKRKNNG
jgi:enoyl-CoA hydratase/carnithine racemase